MSISKIKTVAFSGIEPVEIDVQVHIGPGLPFFTIVGLPDKSIAEAKERIRAVLNVIGLSLPAKRITVNMSPASLQKEGSHYDLAIAVGLLVAMNIIPADSVENAIILGELSLDGTLQPVPGSLMAAMLANARELSLICPFPSAAEAKLASSELMILPMKNVQEVICFTKGEYIPPITEETKAEELQYGYDMKDVVGQEMAKRALEIAAVGNFHVLMIGPPGIGKSMLAKRMITILPDLTPKEAIEVTMIYSIANKLQDKILKRKRPFQDPHHSASLPALVGGGSKAQPGEISLAHNGILFLDELGQYSKALDGLRESMESGQITIARAQNHITYPAQAQIIAAMNPCKCGYFGTFKECSRAPICAKEYQNKISGPIMDRFDIIIYLDQENQFTTKEKNAEESKTIKKRVINAQNFQYSLFNKAIKKMKPEQLLLTKKANETLIRYCNKTNANLRNFSKIARIARAIANLEESKEVNENHILQATLYSKR